MTKRKPIVGMSLKMYHNLLKKAADFAENINQLVGEEEEIEQFLFPGMGTLYPVSLKLKGSMIGFGSQNIAPAANGAYTGEFSIESLVDMGGSYVEIGHSERRSLFHETDEMIADKVQLTIESGLIPVLCIGEPKESTNFEWIKSFLENQLSMDLQKIAKEKLKTVIIAYEPVWAIGAANAASAEHVAKIHTLIRESLSNLFGTEAAEKMRIIYGGSVSKDNVSAIVLNENVDGVFVGRFGHDPKNYQAIVESVKTIKK